MKVSGCGYLFQKSAGSDLVVGVLVSSMHACVIYAVTCAFTYGRSPPLVLSLGFIQSRWDLIGSGLYSNTDYNAVTEGVSPPQFVLMTLLNLDCVQLPLVSHVTNLCAGARSGHLTSTSYCPNKAEVSTSGIPYL